MKVRFLTFALLLTFSFTFSQNNYWVQVPESGIRLSGTRQIEPEKYQTFRADLDLLKQRLFAAPLETEQNISASQVIITIPSPDGRMLRYRVVESPMLMPELATSFPDLKSFSLLGIDDPSSSGKADFNEFGFHAMIFSLDGDFFVDPYCAGNITDYQSYYTRDFVKPLAHRAIEVGVLREGDQPEAGSNNDKAEEGGLPQQKSASAPCVGGQFKSYRLAIACTGEYAIAATGFSNPSLAQTLSKVMTTVNRVNGIYEKEVAVRLVLVPTTTLVLYTDPATDSFTGTANNNAGTLINLSQTIISNSVGTANFDIGHTFSTGGGGLAFLGVVCNNSQKARGVTGSSFPVGDPYDVDYVAHEIGHQFGAEHTFNAITFGCNGNRSSSTAMEPGSGITIMGYAGLCGSNDLANNSIPYFHAVSYDQIVNFTNGSASGCASIITTSNQAPSVTGSATYYIPRSTPFQLTATGSDPDGDVVYYSWEQFDAGISGGNWNSGLRPYFRTYAPDTSPTRYFPNKNVVLTGNYTGTKGEYLPSTAQTLNFRVTVRDNKGGVCYDQTSIEVDTTGPFKVLYPSVTGISWNGNSQQTILWDPVFTFMPPISCDSVRILISYDSGKTYQTLVYSAPNYGFYTTTVPNVTATINTCRIRVEAAHNIFYDISDNNFTITKDVTVGMQDLSQNGNLHLSVWPNPARESLQYAASFNEISGNAQLQVLDLLGKVIYEKTFQKGERIHGSLDTGGYSAGMYFISVSSAGNQAVHRFIKE